MTSDPKIYLNKRPRVQYRTVGVPDFWDGLAFGIITINIIIIIV
jgi:hypothetical protein